MSVMMRRDYRLIYKRMTLKEFAEKTKIPVSRCAHAYNSPFFYYSEKSVDEFKYFKFY